uniref:Ig-like domain-containing protein n=1 Tax=Periophthalmus magnuspinnatus TaxID=409849 RepID=A0A3B4BE06_9GOBI
MGRTVPVQGSRVEDGTTPTAPTVFPVMPCNSGTGTDVTLACLATGFSPSAVSFTWTKGDVALTDSIQYPPVLKDNLYSGVSQIRIPRNDWENRASYKCKVDHAAGNKEVNFIKPNVIYQLPNLTMMTSEENEQVTFSCLANNFAPNVFDFNWLKDSANINTDLAFTMPPKAVKTTKGTVYSAASFLTLPVSNVHSYDKFTCNFKLGKGQKQLTTNITQEYSPSDKCAGDMTIIPPSVQDMLYYRTGKIRCEVNVAEPNKVISVSWTDEKLNVLMNNTDEGAEVRGQRFVLDLEITYNEWNSGIRRVCQLDHQDLLTDPLKKQTPPSVFMLAPVKQTKDNKVTLTCYVKNFNPKEIYVTWLIDDKESKHDFNTTNSMKINGDYYAYSHLTVPLNEWEESEHVYSCLVYHEAIDENTNIVRSITQHTSQQTTMVNLNMKFPDMCKA